jgi:hypothetical protein
MEPLSFMDMICLCISSNSAASAVDYTLFDCKSPASHISELMRPGMHSYLVSFELMEMS